MPDDKGLRGGGIECEVVATGVTLVPDPLRKAGAEVLLSGALMLSDVVRISPSWNIEGVTKASEERFRKALEQLREALS